MDEYEDETPTPPPTYDWKGVHVMAEKCSTCIFRPGNLMNLNPGRVKDMTEGCRTDDTNVICHKTLDREVGAICRGSYDLRPGAQAQIAQRLGVLNFDGRE